MRREESNEQRDTTKADCFVSIFAVALLALGVVWPGQGEVKKGASVISLWEDGSVHPSIFVQASPIQQVQAEAILVETDPSKDRSFVLEDPANLPSDATLLSGTSEQTCLALAIYFEARSEPREGQQAVGEVIVNRVRSKAYPDSVCDVVLQGGASKRYFCQFTFFCDGLPDRPVDRHAWKQANHVAWQILSGGAPRHLQDNVLYYHADYVSPPWAQTMLQVTQIGKHLFYILKARQGRGITSG